MMRRTKGRIIARMASLATVLAVSAFLAAGCGGGDKGDDGKGNGGNPVTPPSGGGSFTDNRDGKTYKTVKIGTQTWMAENLNYQTADSWCYDNKSSNCATYGRLYTWDAAMGACPSGWHLPTRADWDVLVNYVGSSTAGTKLKTSSWGGTNDYGFSALPGGNRNIEGTFVVLGSWGGWWSATDFLATTTAFYRNITVGFASVVELGNDKSDGLSVRCLQD
jgi:uncharacterized protein (TIGR02145 family)